MNKQRSRWLILLVILLVVGNTTWTTANASPYDNTSPMTSKLWQYPTNHANPSPLKGKVIVLDPGHGGSDTGAIGPNHTTEKSVTLTIARELYTLLTKDGATVLMTRTSDSDVAYPWASNVDELQARVAIANEANADLFISIHADAFSASVNGTTTYFYPGTDSSLAHFVQNNLVDQLKLPDRGFQSNDYYVLKNTTMPAILTEVAFISNPKEERLLSNRNFDKKIAIGIRNGIKDYFSNDRRA